MKQLLLSIAILAILSSNSFGTQEEDPSNSQTPATVPRVEDGRTGSALTLDELVVQLGGSDVVFLGEQHDNDSGHAFQLEVIQKLVANGHSVAISMEQLERDVQGALNDYLAGSIDEEKFLASSRPWGNYKNHYRPIVEFAKANQIPVIAANIPRSVASKISSGESVGFLERPYLPREASSPKDAYWDRFEATMKGHLGADGEIKLQRFYESQCLKDDAMAEAITDFIAVNSHNPKIVVHLCGHFHSDYGMGTVSRVMTRRPLTRTTIVTMELQQEVEDKKKVHAKKKADQTGRAHFIFFSVKNQKKEREGSDAK